MTYTHAPIGADHRPSRDRQRAGLRRALRRRVRAVPAAMPRARSGTGPRSNWARSTSAAYRAHTLRRPRPPARCAGGATASRGGSGRTAAQHVPLQPAPVVRPLRRHAACRFARSTSQRRRRRRSAPAPDRSSTILRGPGAGAWRSAGSCTAASRVRPATDSSTSTGRPVPRSCEVYDKTYCLPELGREVGVHPAQLVDRANLDELAAGLRSTSSWRSRRLISAPGSPTTNTRACSLRAALAASITVAALSVSSPSVSSTMCS